jgi:Papain family cysteine protease
MSAIDRIRRPVTMSQRLFDARPDRVDFRDLPYRPPLTSLPARCPEDRDLARWLPGYVKAGLILNQGTEGACTGFGLASVANYLLWVRHVETGARAAFAAVSPRMLYQLAKRYDEWQGEQYQGSSCRGALKGWYKHGVCSARHWPYALDARGRAVFVPPSPGWERDALSRTLGVYYRVNRASVVDLQAAIVNIGAVYVSAQVHDGWDVLMQAGVTPAPRRHADIPDIPPLRNASRLGGHAFALVGYDARGFIVQNSWGRAWGRGGFGRLLYGDWVAHVTDVWACALGVPADPSTARVDATRWRIPSGRGAGQIERTGRTGPNPPADPWPFDHEFAWKPYEPFDTATAYGHTLVTGNDGELVVRDLTKGGPSSGVDHAREIVHDLPLEWLARRPRGKVRLAIYAHGGLNSEDESIQRIRVLAPYFTANDIYPLFLTWRTGVGETLRSMVADWVGRIPGFDRAREEGFRDWLADQKDRAIEAIARPLGRGLWGEMRENAERSMRAGNGLDLLVGNLRPLAVDLARKGRILDVHLVGHSAGAILLGHLLEHLIATGAGNATAVRSCTLFAPACSVRFANERFVRAAAERILPLDRLWLGYLDDVNEKRDGLPSPHPGLYGKSLLYLVSRALDDARKIPLLGMARAHEPKYAGDADQWAREHLRDVRAWQRTWTESRGPEKRTTLVTRPTARVTKAGGQVQSTHGSFDNNIEILTAAIERIRGAKLKAEMEWLDY